MESVYQDPLFKVSRDLQLFHELANRRFRAQIQIKLFLPRWRVLDQVGKEMDTDGHVVPIPIGTSRVSRDLLPLQVTSTRVL
jgi:hypothetical protein